MPDNLEGKYGIEAELALYLIVLILIISWAVHRGQESERFKEMEYCQGGDIVHIHEESLIIQHGNDSRCMQVVSDPSQYEEGMKIPERVFNHFKEN